MEPCSRGFWVLMKNSTHKIGIREYKKLSCSLILTKMDLTDEELAVET